MSRDTNDVNLLISHRRDDQLWNSVDRNGHLKLYDRLNLMQKETWKSKWLSEVAEQVRREHVLGEPDARHG